ncbi:MAG: hypothetical protein ACLQMF_06540 [Rectinemataceae bacterium]
MDVAESYVNDQLKIDLAEDGETHTVRFLGKSFLRDPNVFVLPILTKVLQVAINDGKRMVIDFCNLDYMNSSTLTPVIKILERVRVGVGELTVTYRKSLKWQDISFSALIIFQTTDRRIEIAGMD